jgi:hypothetical protein
MLDMSQGKTLSDYYQPLNPLTVMAALETIKGARTQNRLAEMEATEKIKGLAQNKEFMELLTGYMGGPGTQQPQMAPEGFTGPMPAKTVPPSANWAQMPPEVQKGLVAASPEKSWALMQTGQGRADEDRKMRMDWLKSSWEKLTEAGDDEGMKTLSASLAGDPDPAIAQIGTQLQGIRSIGPGKSEGQMEMDAPQLAALSQKAATPELAQAIASATPGAYQVKQEHGRVVSFSPAKDTGDADLKEFEQVTGTPASQRGTPGYQKAFLGYQRQKKENITVNVGGQGENEYSFPNWDQAAKDKTYEQLAFFGQRPTFGLGKNISRDAFNKGYGEWLAKNNITPEDVASGRAAAKFTQSTATQQTKALLSTIDPLLGKLLEAGQVLGNSNVPAYNRAVNFLKRETGSGDITAFDNLRDDVVAEVERGLLNTGVLSDFKYHRAITNLNSAQSLEQLEAAVENTRKVIHARLEAIGTGGNINVPGTTRRPTGGGQPQQRNLAPAATYLKGAKTQDDLTTRVTALRQKGWTDAEIKQAFGGK